MHEVADDGDTGRPLPQDSRTAVSAPGVRDRGVQQESSERQRWWCSGNIPMVNIS